MILDGFETQQGGGLLNVFLYCNPNMIHHEKIKAMKPCLELVILEVASSDMAFQADSESFNTLQLEHGN